MGKYYNKTRTPLAATTRSGESLSFPPRVWISVPDHEEASSSIMTAVRRGFLAYQSPTTGDLDAVVSQPVVPSENTEEAKVEETTLKVATSDSSSKTVSEEPAISDSSSIISEVENPEESTSLSESDVAYGDGSGTESTAPRKNRRR